MTPDWLGALRAAGILVGLCGVDHPRLVSHDRVQAVLLDAAALRGMVIIESKSGRPPSPVDRWLWSNGHRPIRVLKFCTSLAALFPELPSNRWNRALHQPWQVSASA